MVGLLKNGPAEGVGGTQQTDGSDGAGPENTELSYHPTGTVNAILPPKANPPAAAIRENFLDRPQKREIRRPEVLTLVPLA